MSSLITALTQCALIKLDYARISDPNPWFCHICGNKFKTHGNGYKHLDRNWFDDKHASVIKETYQRIAKEESK